jgi:hypothetical protein
MCKCLRLLRATVQGHLQAEQQLQHPLAGAGWLGAAQHASHTRGSWPAVPAHERRHPAQQQEGTGSDHTGDNHW